MAAYSASDVGYSTIDGYQPGGNPATPMAGRAFALNVSGGKTYPSGGIPLTKGSLGCPSTIQQFLWLDDGSSSGYVAKFDLSATKLRLYEIADGGTIAFTSALTEVGTSETVAATTWKCFVAGW